MCECFFVISYVGRFKTNNLFNTNKKIPAFFRTGISGKYVFEYAHENLVFYASDAWDIMYNFPSLGFDELEGGWLTEGFVGFGALGVGHRGSFVG